MFLSGIFESLVRPHVEKAVERGIMKALDEQLPKIVKERLCVLFETRPNEELTRTGWYWACAWALQRHWKDVDDETANKWLAEYIGVRYGAKGYTWTAADAKHLADQYASEFGEAA